MDLVLAYLYVVHLFVVLLGVDLIEFPFVNKKMFTDRQQFASKTWICDMFLFLEECLSRFSAFQHSNPVLCVFFC